MYQEHSFPAAAWMGGWKATHLMVLMAAVWTCLKVVHTLLSSCKALGPIHRRFRALPTAQQRNVSLYVTHLLLDTAVLFYVAFTLLHLWLGITETTGETRRGLWKLTYLVACYTLELTWRHSIDPMLAVQHIGTIVAILMFAGELTVSSLPQNPFLALSCARA
jgi:hypothetical protein